MRTDIRLRPPATDDIDLLVRPHTDPDAHESFGWFRPDAATRLAERVRRGDLEDDGGLLVVQVDGEAAGDVSWRAVRYGPVERSDP